VELAYLGYDILGGAKKTSRTLRTYSGAYALWR